MKNSSHVLQAALFKCGGGGGGGQQQQQQQQQEARKWEAVEARDRQIRTEVEEKISRDIRGPEAFGKFEKGKQAVF